VLGLCSLLLPLLSIPGFITGVVSLRRIRRNPSLPGRSASTAGVITSLVLGPLVTAVTIAIVIGLGSYSVGTPGFAWVPITPFHPTPYELRLPPALLAASSTPGTEITPAQAKSIFSTMWTLRQTAFRDTNRSMMAEFEYGPALEADEATCGCTTRDPRGPIINETLLVPKQSTLPATFLGEATTTLDGSPYVQYLIITKESTAMPWMVEADPGFNGRATLDAPATESDGYDQSTTASTPRDANGLPALLASYWQTWTNRGHAPTPTTFAPGQWTTEAGGGMTKAPQGSVVAFNGLIGHYRYQPGASDEIWHFSTSHGSLTCGVVRDETYWTSPGGDIYQPTTMRNWGATVAPGLYKAAVTSEIAQPCFTQRPDQLTSVVSGLFDSDTVQGVHLIDTGPNSTPTSPTSVSGTPPTGQLQNGDAAIVAIDPATNAVTLDINSQDVRYTLCSHFSAISPSGVQLGSTGLQVGDFATVNIDESIPCLKQFAVLAAPHPPQCKAINSVGFLSVVFDGSNATARSIVYTDGNESLPTTAQHWCAPPTVVALDGSATTLASIPAGTDVKIDLSGNGWITGVQVEVPGSVPFPTLTPAAIPPAP
jgi:hypothetical protein